MRSLQFAPSEKHFEPGRHVAMNRSGLGFAIFCHAAMYVDQSLCQINPITFESKRDVDLITFFRRPALHFHDYAWENFVKKHLNLFLRERTHETYGCDSIFVDLSGPSDYLVGQTRYWFGLFSHKRSGVWKGMLHMPLGQSVDDNDAMQLLNGRKQ
jgi:hypothetical protein